MMMVEVDYGGDYDGVYEGSCCGRGGMGGGYYWLVVKVEVVMVMMVVVMVEMLVVTMVVVVMLEVVFVMMVVEEVEVGVHKTLFPYALGLGCHTLSRSVDGCVVMTY